MSKWGEKEAKKAVRPLPTKDKLLKAGELAKLAGVLVSTVRFYTKLGMLSADGYTPGKYNLYARDKALKRLQRIEGLKRRRLTLDEIVATLGVREVR
ncbi:helix-turn-helix MerR-family like proteins [Candidatus Termititenax persephonae]|uniref:Helix-turn-helix MerR-family like proteins n=1 Tax=Candidatus Termititenax persephonae TaxID=2218525 RepID=A0A388TF10_9BACT|nr:helix-turn-helix MerR-family like proteins [Candidatus Termititenax persephonae]